MIKYIKHFKLKCVILLLVPIIYILNKLGSYFPNQLESIYSDGTNHLLRIILSNITGIFPFSLAELLIVALVFIFIFLLVRFVFALFHKKGLNELSNITIFFALIYILFILTWGGNYNRHSFDQLTNLPVRQYSTTELISLCEKLIDKTNELREQVTEDEDGIMIIPGNFKDTAKRAYLGYDILSERVPQLRGYYGPAKPFLISPLMMYTGITGVFIPYTAEANINVHIEDYSLPHTICHEMAHQRGFSPEDEANYIAYLACMSNPDYDFQYSGAITAMIYCMNALYRDDYNSYAVLSAGYSDAVRRDLVFGYEYWKAYEGKVEEVATSVNNTYLITNGQSDGVKSYGKMVDLIIAYFIETGNLY